jgi:uncharacterized metal-binding protein YceD (DUF177 family)
MNYMKNFIIPFSGLKVGNHNFTFDIGDKFFDHFIYAEIKKGEVHIDCLLEKQSRMMILHFDISGTVRVPCDRCGEEFDLAIEGTQSLIVKYGETHTEESEDILLITEKEHELDLGQNLYEYIHLLLPIKKTHPEDEQGNSMCNPEITRFIQEPAEQAPDPRWEVLQKLKKNIKD